MTFFESIKTVFRKYAEFEGRATRPEFWWFTLFSAIVAGALGSLNVTTSLNNGSDSSTVYLGASLAAFWSVAVLVPSLAVGVRRLRDTGRAATNILWILLPIAGIIILIIWWAEPTKSDAIAIAQPASLAPPAPPAPPAA